MNVVRSFVNYVIFCELCNQMRFEVNCAKSHHGIIPEGLKLALNYSKWHLQHDSLPYLPLASIVFCVILHCHANYGFPAKYAWKIPMKSAIFFMIVF